MPLWSIKTWELELSHLSVLLFFSKINRPFNSYFWNIKGQLDVVKTNCNTNEIHPGSKLWTFLPVHVFQAVVYCSIKSVVLEFIDTWTGLRVWYHIQSFLHFVRQIASTGPGQGTSIKTAPSKDVVFHSSRIF